ncbi:MAG: response regulator [Hyphomicrobiales bacterium]
MKPLVRIMFIDDDADIRTVGLIALETVGGFTVQPCGSGREALESVAAFNPDLILLDVMMPDMDGPATLRALRALPEASEVPVVFFTAKTQRGDIDKLADLGALGVLAKPFDPMTLAAEIGGLWDDRDSGAEAMCKPEPPFEALRTKFRQEAISDMDEIENLGTTLTDVAAVSQTNKLLFEMHRLAHKLAGRGGTFGYPDVSKRGAALEAAVAEIRAAEGNFPAANLRRMYDLIAGLRTAIDALP